jgi:3-oxoacyl-[acyl-carrier protein] reductase
VQRVAIVTGASRGIGRAVALALAAERYAVVMVARDRAALESAAGEVQAHGGRPIVLPADVAAESDLLRIVDAARSAGGPVEVLVNNAGISPKPRDGRRTPLLEMSLGEWNEVLAVNLTSAFVLTRDIGRMMCDARRGSIVNVASVAARIGALTAGAHYVASKAAMVGFTKAAALEFAPYGVRVNGVAPGRIATAMTARASVSVPQGWLESHVPLARQGEAAEVAEAVAFLASERSSYITGSTVDVSGGWTMT